MLIKRVNINDRNKNINYWQRECTILKENKAKSDRNMEKSTCIL